MAPLIKPTDEVIERVADLLKSKDPAVLVAAINAFHSFEHLGLRWFPDVAAHTEHRDRHVRRAVSEALCAFLKHSPAFDDSLVALVRDRDADVRRLTVKRLGEMRNHIEELRDKADKGALTLPEQGVLKRYEGHVSGLQSRLFIAINEGTTPTTDADIVACSIEALGYVARFTSKAEQGKVHALLETLLNSSDASVCASAAYAIENCPSDRATIADTLADILQDPRKTTRCRINAARAIGRLPSATTRTADALLMGMRSPDSDVKWAVAESIGLLENPFSKSQLSQFLALTSHTDSRVRQGASWAIGFLSKPDKEFLNALVRLLNDGDEYVSFSAAEALGKVSHLLDDQHVAGIVALVASEDRAVRKNAVEALGLIDRLSKEAATALVSSLKDPEPAVRWAAVRSFGLFKGKTAHLVPEVAPLLDYSRDGRVVASAIEVLGHVGTLDDATLGKIIGLVQKNDAERDHRWSFAKACKSLQRCPPEAIEILCSLAYDPDAQVSAAATTTIRSLTSDAERSCRLLADSLRPRIEKDHHLDVQATVRIVDCIGDLLPHSPDAEVANSALCALLADPDQDIRRHAAHSLTLSRGCDTNCFRRLVRCIPDDSGDEIAVALVGSQPARAEALLRRDLARMRYQFPDRTTTILMLAHILGGGEGDNETFIRAVLRPDGVSVPPSASQLHDEIRVIANVRRSLDEIPEEARLPADAELIADTEEKLTERVKEGSLLWGESDKAEVAKLSKCVTSDKLADEIDSALNETKGEWSWVSIVLTSAGIAIVGHLLFWTAFIVFYPRWGPAEAFFRWSPLIGNIATLGYVMLAFQWIGFLRRRLLEPYRSQLLPVDAEGDEIRNSVCPVAKAEVRTSGAEHGKCVLVKDLESDKGRWVMIGDSQSGKTHVLRYLAATSKEVAAYVPATACSQGVDKCVVSMLQGNIAHSDFVATVVRNGGMPLFIDGYDDAGNEAKEQITRFAKDNNRATLFVAATSVPPDLKRLGIIALLPLSPGERLDFLRFLFEKNVLEEKRLTSSEYDIACAQVLHAIDQVRDDRPGHQASKAGSPGRLVAVAKSVAAGEQITEIVRRES
jgi:HEAT repeat protein